MWLYLLLWRQLEHLYNQRSCSYPSRSWLVPASPPIDSEKTDVASGLLVVLYVLIIVCVCGLFGRFMSST